MNALLLETKTDRIDLGLPILPQLRVSPTVRAFLLDAKPANESWADFATRSMLVTALLADTIGLRLTSVHRTVVRLMGEQPDARQAATPAHNPSRTTVREPDRLERPVQMSLKTALVEAGKRGR